MPHTYRFQIGALVGFGIMAIVSIPERVWGGLELSSTAYITIDTVFQSLRGFGVGWSQLLSAHRRPPSRFQSLRGFGVGWSHSLDFSLLGGLLFQSLRGFGVGWSIR